MGTRQNWTTHLARQPVRLFGQSTQLGPRLGESRWIEPSLTLVPPAWLARASLGKIVNIGNLYVPIHTVCMGNIVWEMIN